MSEPILEIKNLNKSYDSLNVLNNISLVINKGEVLVIVGPSGCGKSTLLRCINGLEQIQRGDIYLQGEKISNIHKNMHKVRQRIGMVFQVLDVMLELASEGSTMVIVTHEMQFARAIADRIVFIDQGKIIEESAPEEFFTSPKSLRVKQFLNIFEFDTVG